MSSKLRIGHGFDVHRLQRGRKLVLGGVEIPNQLGLIGHSDADVLLHSLVNAILGAMGKGDIGSHFPDSDPTYKDASSQIFIRKVHRMMTQGGFRLVNGDITVIAQKPRLCPFFDKMRINMARLLKVQKGRLNIKAATTEQLGWIGQGGGIAAIAVVLLEKSSKN